MLRTYDTVRLKDLSPQMVLAAVVIEGIYRNEAGVECWITSANDRQHSAGSLHYKGQALDFRMHNVSGNRRQAVVAKIRASLSDADFDILWEDVGTPNEHLHIEYQPK